MITSDIDIYDDYDCSNDDVDEFSFMVRLTITMNDNQTVCVQG